MSYIFEKKTSNKYLQICSKIYFIFYDYLYDLIRKSVNLPAF